MNRKLMVGTVFALAGVLGGCGDDDTSDITTPDSGADAADIDAEVPEADADLPEPPGPAPVLVPLSAEGANQFFGATYDAAGNLFAVGYADVGGGDYAFAVAKFLPNGSLDANFGIGGIAKKNVAVGGKTVEQARAIAVQPSGKIVIGGVAEHDAAAADAWAKLDTDIFLVRFLATGAVDTDFGTMGVLRFDEGTGYDNTAAPTTAVPNPPARAGGTDTLWNIFNYPGDKLVLQGSHRAAGTILVGEVQQPRKDTNWLTIRTNANGVPDADFGVAGSGKFDFDIEGENASARSGVLLPDGSLIGTGYASTSITTNTTQIVLYKLNNQGQLFSSFGGVGRGFFHDLVLTTQTEAYDAVVQGTSLVTIGYGRNVGAETNDMVSARFHADGTRDMTYGTLGRAIIDVAGRADNARDILALPDGRLVVVGTGEPTTVGSKDAVIGILTANGQLDTTWGPQGWKAFDLGGTADQFWSANVSPDGKTVAFVGLKGVATQTAASNTDAAVFFLPIPAAQ